eukprot:CAMPEP_0176431280 /NCGR_PEP_ID=MMETSP0127-20121128/14728_1 /TAXON_ID=938130 /ORGANISM="Platyophrya macrostoma, Strain WH" /LENGTH=821 /DNA_ID=CAMNT_0017813277 /DNA_START=87 /DNA_END=2552 /DNA_ORIENTATION=-
MDTISYVSQESNRNVCQANNVVPLARVKATQFSEELPPLAVSGSNRILCYTNKKPAEVTLLNRIEGKKADTVLSFSVTHLVSMSELTYVAAGAQSIVFLTADLHADGAITVSSVEGSLPDPICALAANTNGTVAVTTTAGQLLVVGSDGNKVSSFGLPSTPKAPIRSNVLAVHKELQLAVVPGKNQTALDIISLNSEKSILSKPWFPHGDVPADAAYIIQNRQFTGAAAGSRFVLTTAHRNTELRFWMLSEDNNMSLVEQLTVTTQSADESRSQTPRLLTVNQTEEYVLLASTTVPSIVIVELDRIAFKASRVTDWFCMAPALFCVSFIRKVKEAKTLSIDLSAVIRTTEQLTMFTMDASRLAGSSNLLPLTPMPSASNNAGSAASAQAATTNVTKWFGASAESPMIIPPTSVSSSIAGNKVTSSSADAQFVAGQAAAALKEQSAAFGETFSEIDEKLVSLQKNARQITTTFQDPKLKDEAQFAGREFALRNKHRLNQAAGAPTPVQPQVTTGGHVVMTPAQADLMQGVRNLIDAIPGYVRTATAESTKKLLGGVLPQAVSRAMSAAESVDQDAALPKLTITEGMQTFSAAIDKIQQSQNNILKQERATNESLCLRMVPSNERHTKVLQTSKSFLQSVKSELSLLRDEINCTKKIVKDIKTLGGAATVPVQSAEEVLAEAVALCSSGQWSEAVAKVDALGDLPSLMHLLQSDICTEQRGTITSSSTLPLPLMLQVCRKLANNITEQPGNVPFRAKWVHDFIVDWDDKLVELKTNDASQIAALQPILEEIVANLSSIDPRNTDRATRNNVKLVDRLIQPLIA